MHRLLKNRILLVIAILVVVAVVRFGTQTIRVDGPGPLPSPAAGHDAPSSDNVSHDFRVRTSELRARLDREPADSLALHDLAAMLFDAHQMEEAAGLYDRYLAIVPRARQAWLDLATAQAALERWEDAERTMGRMLELYPDDAAATWNLGAIAANQGRRDEAAEWWHRTVDSPDSALAGQARRALSQLYAR